MKTTGKRTRMRAQTPTLAEGERAPWRWAALGLLQGALCVVLWQAPAAWLAWGVEQASAQRVHLLESSGTVWDGSARLVLDGGADEPLALPGFVQWQWGWHGGGLTAAVSAPCCLSSPWVWQLRLDAQGVEVRPADLPAAQAMRLPSSLLSGLGAPWNTLQLQGQLQLSTDQLALRVERSGSVRWQGRAQLDALQMHTRLSTLHPVGSYRMVLQAQSETAHLQLSTLEGALVLNASGQWSGQRFQLNGTAHAAPGYEEALANLLNIVGRRDGARTIIQIG